MKPHAPADYLLFLDGSAAGVIAQEIVEDLEAALAEFSAVAQSLAPADDAT